MSFEVGADKLEVRPLGSGQEVGRSAVLVKYKGKTILFDCGVHPAYSGIESLPYFDKVDLSTIDLVLVSHFHLDHCGGLINKTHCFSRSLFSREDNVQREDFYDTSNQSDLYTLAP
jgi:Cft2 family RNA processing exonuclease